MKKIIVVFLVLIMVLPNFLVSAENHSNVVDNDNLLTDSQEESLSEHIAKIEDKFDFEIVIHTTDYLDNKHIELYTADFFMDNGYGIGTTRDGLILTVYSGLDEDIREFCSAGHGYGEEATGVYFYECLFDESDVVSLMSDNEFFAAFEDYLNLAEIFLTEYQNGNGFSSSNPYRKIGFLGSRYDFAEILIGLFVILCISALAAFIYLQVLKSKMKTVRKALFARQYVREGSFVLKRCADIFLFSNITKVRIKTDSPKGGGSFRSSGGSSFSGGSSRF